MEKQVSYSELFDFLSMQEIRQRIAKEEDEEKKGWKREPEFDYSRRY